MMIPTMTHNKNATGCLTHTPRIPVAVSVAVILPGKLIFNSTLKRFILKEEEKPLKIANCNPQPVGRAGTLCEGEEEAKE